MTAKAAAAVPFGRAAGLLEDLAGVRLTVKRVERAAEADGAAQATASRARAGLIARRKLVPLPPDPLPDKLYMVIDGTGVPVTSKETAGRQGKGEDGRARTREVKMAVFFTQDKVDDEGYPVRDKASSSYIATFEPAAAFGDLVKAEGIRRGADHVRQLTIIGDGAAWIWGIATSKFPEATQIVDLYHGHFENVSPVLLNGRVATATRPAVTEAALRAAAGERSFERGTRYLNAVSSMETVGKQVIATVRGNGDYLVVLTLPERASGARLRGECNCPYGQEGFFCKHCVAVGLAILRDARAVPRQRAKAVGPSNASNADTAGRAGTTSGTKPSDLSAWLNSLSRDELVALVCDQVVEDGDWRRRLQLHAASAASDVPAVKDRVLSLLSGDEEYGQNKFSGQYGYLEGPESWYYARRVRQVTDAVRQLSAAGHAGDAMLIAEQALAALTGSSRHASDRAGVIAAAAAELAAAHQEACRATAADPVRLADFLAARMIDPDDAEPVDPAGYADLLGADGTARLRERISAAWTANPAGWSERQAMESILTLLGDIDGLVAVLASNLDGRGYAHLRIAAELDRAGRADEALTWAERGLRESGEPGQPLADYVVGRYRAAGRIAEALTVRRERFQAAPSVTGYQLLREIAELAGAWDDVRKWALRLLREQAARRSRPPGLAGAQGWTGWTPACVLVDVLIADGDIDAAWAAADGLASDDQWLRLANLVIETRPADALAVYRRLIAMLTRETGDAVYERIAQLLAAARACHRRIGTEAAFAVYLRALREDHKRKHKLIRVLDAHGLR